MDSELDRFLTKISKIIEKHGGDEILINGSRGVFVTGASSALEIPKLSEDIAKIADLIRFLAKRSGLRIDALRPACGGFIADLDLRWHALVRPVAQDEMVLSLRRHRFKVLTLRDYGITDDQYDAIHLAISQKNPIVIGGPTGAGKTSLLVSILKNWHFSRRVIMIETVSELPSLSPFWIRLTETHNQVSGIGSFSLEQVARETLRLKPEVLVVSELRGQEAQIFFDMSRSGHGGCLATIHADSSRSLEVRIRRMVGGVDNLTRSTESLPITTIMIERKHDDFKISEIATVQL